MQRLPFSDCAGYGWSTAKDSPVSVGVQRLQRTLSDFFLTLVLQIALLAFTLWIVLYHRSLNNCSKTIHRTNKDRIWNKISMAPKSCSICYGIKNKGKILFHLFGEFSSSITERYFSSPNPLLMGDKTTCFFYTRFLMSGSLSAPCFFPLFCLSLIWLSFTLTSPMI